MLESYIYKNLQRYGNCLISENLMKRIGKNKILKDLKEHGLDCTIEVRKVADRKKYMTHIEEFVIIEVKK